VVLLLLVALVVVCTLLSCRLSVRGPWYACWSVCLSVGRCSCCIDVVFLCSLPLVVAGNMPNIALSPPHVCYVAYGHIWAHRPKTAYMDALPLICPYSGGIGAG
jgi:hypothetical protein